MIVFDRVGKRYADGQAALSHVSFELAQGEMTFLTGHSGAGKTTLLKLIALLERCSQGQIIVAGKNLNKVTTRQIPYWRRHIGIVLQDAKLLGDRNVFHNVALPLVIAGYRYKEILRRTRAALAKVGLAAKEKLYPMALSSGEQQRVSIARAVVHKPPLLLADEPTGNLDPKLSADIMQLFEQFNRVGVTVLIASHDMQLIHRLAHRILVLEQGQLLQEGNSSPD